MAISWTAIANAALTKLGARLIADIDVDATVEARTCKARYEAVRDLVLRMHPWGCATKRVVLAPSVTTPAFEWSYQFTLPADFLRVALVGPNAPDYLIENGNLLADTTVIYLKYVSRVTDPTLLDPLLSEAIAIYLAHDIAFRLMQSEALREDMRKMFDVTMAQARSVNGQDNPAQEFLSSAFLEARTGGTGTLSAGHYPR